MGRLENKRFKKGNTILVSHEKNQSNQSLIIDKADRVPLVLICLFMLVDWVPSFNAVDVMASQWVYLGVINLLAAIYIAVIRKKEAAS